MDSVFRTYVIFGEYRKPNLVTPTGYKYVKVPLAVWLHEEQALIHQMELEQDHNWVPKESEYVRCYYSFRDVPLFLPDSELT